MILESSPSTLMSMSSILYPNANSAVTIIRRLQHDPINCVISNPEGSPA